VTGHAYVVDGLGAAEAGPLAREMAKGVMCLSPGDASGTPGAGWAERVCGCGSCVLMDAGGNPDFKFIGGDGAVSVDEVRSIIGDARVKPLYSARKAYVIMGAERMTVQAQNALLKSLEDPPPDVAFILVTESWFSLLETVRSRSVRLRMGGVGRGAEAALGAGPTDAGNTGAEGVGLGPTASDGTEAQGAFGGPLGAAIGLLAHACGPAVGAGGSRARPDPDGYKDMYPEVLKNLSDLYRTMLRIKLGVCVPDSGGLGPFLRRCAEAHGIGGILRSVSAIGTAMRATEGNVGFAMADGALIMGLRGSLVRHEGRGLGVAGP